MRTPTWKPLLSILPVLLPSAIIGCATIPAGKDRDPAYLTEKACSIGRDVTEAKGSVWLKAKSREASGQFPANVKARQPDHLEMEVTNLLGGTEAVIRVEGQRFSIQSSNKKVRNQTGYGTWGGIPLTWASELFLGRVPCPPASALAAARATVTDDGELKLETPKAPGGAQELYLFKFRNWGGESWPDELHWERKGHAPATVDFKFDDPEDPTGSPRKWEAKSSRGEVKVRWKDRELSR